MWARERNFVQFLAFSTVLVIYQAPICRSVVDTITRSPANLGLPQNPLLGGPEPFRQQGKSSSRESLGAWFLFRGSFFTYSWSFFAYS